MNNYTPYKYCIIRTPLFPINFIKNLHDFSSSIFSQLFKEAVYIASPILYKELYIKNNISEKTINSAIKYFSRCCTRCTPYGTFAGCTIVPVNDNPDSFVVMGNYDGYRTYTRIDMNYLCEYIRRLEASPKIREAIKYQINSSLYRIGKNLRYIEYRNNNLKRKYLFSEVLCDGSLNRLIRKLKRQPLTVNEMVEFVSQNEGVENTEAYEYINTLIDEQIIISELAPSVVGKDLIYQIKEKLAGINVNSRLIDDLIELLQKCDREKLGSKEPIIKNIYKSLLDNKLIKQDTLIQVDCLNKASDGSIGNNIVKVISTSISLFSRLFQRQKLDIFENFKNKFYDKYEDQEVPLVVALDTQIGIGYGRWNDISGDVNPLISDLPTPTQQQSDNIGIKLTPLTMLLSKKYEDAIKYGLEEIRITEEDIMEIKESDLGLHQCAAMISVLSSGYNPSIYLKGILGGTCSRLLSRFEYLDGNIENLVNAINRQDEQHYDNCIVAEIIHLPEDRIGNIQMHPNNRQYGICYLSNPTPEYPPNIISIEDIMISVPYGRRIVLRSKRYNKEIIPMLSTAHNTMNGLPIYSFLTDFVNQDTRSYSFDWGEFFQNKEFLPRVTFLNIILKPARWIINAKDFSIDKSKNVEELLAIKNRMKIPNEVFISVGDNQLYINFNNEQLVSILIKEIMNRKVIILEEFLFKAENVNLVKSDKGFFANEVIINLYRQ